MVVKRAITWGGFSTSASSLDGAAAITASSSPGLGASGGLSLGPPLIWTLTRPVIPCSSSEATASSLIGVARATSIVTRTCSLLSGSMRMSLTAPTGTPR